MEQNMQKRKYTLAEILTVVVALGFFLVIASILIPQFTEAVTESNGGEELGHNLVVMRSQTELYKIQHNDDLPSTAANVSFEQALTQKTNIEGPLVDSTLNPAGCCGPYLCEIPESCYNCLDTVEIDRILGGDWYFNTTTTER
jgi:competence protein ComGC